MKYVYFLAIVFFSYSGMAQTDLEKKVNQLELQLSEQIERNTILKGALDLRERGKEMKQEEVTIRITSLRHDAESGDLRAQGLITYHGSKSRNLQFVQQQVVDPEGSTYETYKVVKPKEESQKVFLQKVTADVPYSFLIKFEGIKAKPATLSLLRVQIYGDRPGSVLNFDFKGLEVGW
ncbi:MAG TPA: hypothetical protein VKZ57_11835 [Sphingobacterium sp.]|nr:hypothetical protein [Sphingobacterium sp.]